MPGSRITGIWRWAFAPCITFTTHRDKTDETGGDDDQAFNCSGVQPRRQFEKQTTTSIKHPVPSRILMIVRNACTENAITVQLADFFGNPARQTSAAFPPLAKATADTIIVAGISHRVTVGTELLFISQREKPMLLATAYIQRSGIAVSPGVELS